MNHVLAVPSSGYVAWYLQRTVESDALFAVRGGVNVRTFVRPSLTVTAGPVFKQREGEMIRSRVTALDEMIGRSLFPNTPTSFRSAVTASMARRPAPFLELVGTERSYILDVLTALFHISSPLVTRPKSPLVLSPVVWNGKLFSSYTSGEQRDRARVLRNHLLMRRYANRWGISLLNVRRLVDLLFLRPRRSQAYASVLDRLACLPKILHSIKEGSLQCLLLDEPEPWELGIYFTAADDWRVSSFELPGHPQCSRHVLETSRACGELARRLRSDLAQRVGMEDFDDVSLNAAASQGKIYDISRATILHLLDSVITFKGGQKLTHTFLSFARECRRAIEAGCEFAPSSHFEPPPAYTHADGDECLLAQVIQPVLADLGVSPLNTSTKASTSSTGLSAAKHDATFRCVNWGEGCRYEFNATQAAAVAILWPNSQQGIAVHQEEVARATGLGAYQCKQYRLANIFRKHPAWGTMIYQGERRGFYILRDPRARQSSAL